MPFVRRGIENGSQSGKNPCAVLLDVQRTNNKNGEKTKFCCMSDFSENKVPGERKARIE